ncbi:MAG: uroporphyrinogen-III synthase [Xanthobacteraceae bacterium]
MRLLITRAAAEGVRTAAALQQQGHTILLAPLLRIETLAPDFSPGPWDAVIMTSANAARALRGHPRRDELLPLKLFAVGRTTAQAAQACGFRDVVSADGDVSDLLNLLGESPLRTGRLLHLAGADRTVDLSAALAPAGTHVDTVVIYRAVAEARLPDEVESAFVARRIDGVLHFSARTAAAFVTAAAAVGPTALGLPQFCLSAAVAKPLQAAGARDLRIAARPDEAALLDLIGSA